MYGRCAVTEHCETCGQSLPNGEPDAFGSWLPGPGGAHAHGSRGGSRGGSSDSAERSGDRRIVAVLGALLALWAGFFALSTFGDSDDPAATAEGVAPTPEPTANPTPTETEMPADPEPTALEDDVAEATVQPALVEISDNVQVRRLSRQLERRDSSPTLVWRADDSVVFLDVASGTARVAELASNLPITDSVRFLRSGATTFAVDTADDTAALVVSDATILMMQPAGDVMLAVPAQGLSSSAPTVWATRFQPQDMPEDVMSFVTPIGHQLRAFDGLGLLASEKSPDSGTLRATIDGFQPFSDHPIVDGNRAGILEKVCDEFGCGLDVTLTEDGTQWSVPERFVDFSSNYHLSSDGRSLLRRTSTGFAELFIFEDDAVAWVVGRGMQAPVWGDEAKFIAWLDFVAQPELKVMFPDERDWLSIDLVESGIPLPTAADLLVYES